MCSFMNRNYCNVSQFICLLSFAGKYHLLVRVLSFTHSNQFKRILGSSQYFYVGLKIGLGCRIHRSNAVWDDKARRTPQSHHRTFIMEPPRPRPSFRTVMSRNTFRNFIATDSGEPGASITPIAKYLSSSYKAAELNCLILNITHGCFCLAELGYMPATKDPGRSNC